MKYRGALIVVRDMAKAREFYESFLGQEAQDDFGANVAYKGGFALQTLDSWTKFTGKPRMEIRFGANNAELYFETDDLDAFARRAEDAGVTLVHGLTEQPWGQRAIRICDPDGHIVEVGEPMAQVVRRMAQGGMDAARISEQTELTLAAVEKMLDAL